MHATRAPLTIDAADLRLVRLPLVTPFTIASGTMTEKVFALLRLFAGGQEGVAKGVMPALPDYLEETATGAMAFLSGVILPIRGRWTAIWRRGGPTGWRWPWWKWRSGTCGRGR